MYAESQRIEDCRVKLGKRTINAQREDGVIGALAPERPVSQFGGEPCILAAKAMFADTARQHKVRVGVIGRDGPKNLVGDQAGGVRTPGSFSRRRSGESTLA
ncbi:hypothetical protein GCM10027404_31740 [Arthrobacter tumbae]